MDQCVTPIRLDVLLNANQISCCKGKWYVRRLDPDTVENDHIYSSVKEEEVSGLQNDLFLDHKLKIMHHRAKLTSFYTVENLECSKSVSAYITFVWDNAY